MRRSRLDIVIDILEVAKEEKYATTDAGKAFLEKAREITSKI